jgi:enterochelin esterase-like enzyme
MNKILIVFLLAFFCGCTPPSTPAQTATPLTLAILPGECSTPGKIISVDLPQPEGDPVYSYRVYLPPCFSAVPDARYPVLYLLPGSQSSPDSWIKAGLPEEMDRLILSGRVPPLIVVTTENTDNDLEGNTIYRKLIPYVESQYPIAGDRRHRAVAGGSLGGVSAYHLAFQHPDTFSSAGIFGAGAFPWDEEPIRSWLAQMNDSNRTRVFLNSGEQDSYMLERAREMKSILDQAGVENELYVDQGGHHYKYWIPNFGRYLTWLEKGW